jgi:hypothetical protein
MIRTALDNIPTPPSSRLLGWHVLDHGAGGVHHDRRKTLHGDHHHDGEFSGAGQAGADHRRGNTGADRIDRCDRE